MQTHTLEIPERLGGGSVQIRAKQSWGARARVDSAGVFVKPGEEEARIDGRAKGLAILESAVVSWSLDLPATREGFMSDDFDGDVGDWLVDAIVEHYQSQRRSEEDSKNDGSPSMDS